MVHREAARRATAHACGAPAPGSCRRRRAGRTGRSGRAPERAPPHGGGDSAGPAPGRGGAGRGGLHGAPVRRTCDDGAVDAVELLGVDHPGGAPGHGRRVVPGRPCPPGRTGRPARTAGASTRPRRSRRMRNGGRVRRWASSRRRCAAGRGRRALAARCGAAARRRRRSPGPRSAGRAGPRGRVRRRRSVPGSACRPAPRSRCPDVSLPSLAPEAGPGRRTAGGTPRTPRGVRGPLPHALHARRHLNRSPPTGRWAARAPGA